MTQHALAWMLSNGGDSVTEPVTRESWVNSYGHPGNWWLRQTMRLRAYTYHRWLAAKVVCPTTATICTWIERAKKENSADCCSLLAFNDGISHTVTFKKFHLCSGSRAVSFPWLPSRFSLVLCQNVCSLTFTFAFVNNFEFFCLLYALDFKYFVVLQLSTE